MRYLFVYQDFVKPVEALLVELAAADVIVVPVAKRARAVHPDVLLAAQGDGGVCAAVQVDRAYIRTLAGLTLEQNFKRFRADDRVLRDWISPTPPVVNTPPAPSVAFANACEGCGWLVLSDRALDRCDEITPLRWGFVQKSAALLRKLAMGVEIGDLRSSRARHAVDYAPNGRVHFKYRLPGAQFQQTPRHFKEGDGTTAEGAARIYFDLVDQANIRHVVVLYVGPHPADGEYEVTFRDARWQDVAPVG